MSPEERFAMGLVEKTESAEELRIRLEAAEARIVSLEEANSQLMDENEGLKVENVELKKEAETALIDVKTDLWNYRGLLKVGNVLVSQHIREHQKHLADPNQYPEAGPLSVLVLDFDNLKSYNEKYGRPFVDKIFERIGHFLKAKFRATDIVAHKDVIARNSEAADEFIFVLPSAPQQIFERFRNHQSGESQIEFKDTIDDLEVRVTFSGGLALVNLDQDADRALHDAIKRADFATNEAKKQKNRIVISQG